MSESEIAHLRNQANECVSRGDKHQAIEFLSEAIALDPENVFILEQRINLYCDLLNYDAALIDCARAVELWPDVEDFYNKRAFIYDCMGRYDKAIEEITRIIARDPSYPVHDYSYRAYLLYKTGDYANALVDYNKIIEWNPSDYNHYFGRGRVHKALKHFDEAKRDFEHIIAVLPETHPMAQVCHEQIAEIDEIKRRNNAS